MAKKMLVAEINSLEMMNDTSLDGFVLPVMHFSSVANHYFSLDEIKSAINYKKERLIILKLDKVIEEKEIEGLKRFIDQVIDLGVDYFLFSDFAVSNILDGRVPCGKLIYANSKMLASSKECEYYSFFGMINPSTELTIDELKAISSRSNCLITCFGYLNIFYSRRPLLSLFEHHQRKIFRRNLKGKLLFIKEEY